MVAPIALPAERGQPPPLLRTGKGARALTRRQAPGQLALTHFHTEEAFPMVGLALGDLKAAAALIVLQPRGVEQRIAIAEEAWAAPAEVLERCKEVLSVGRSCFKRTNETKL